MDWNLAQRNAWPSHEICRIENNIFCVKYMNPHQIQRDMTPLILPLIHIMFWNVKQKINKLQTTHVHWTCLLFT